MDSSPAETHGPTTSSSRAVNVVRDRLHSSWDYDPNLLTKFFPVNARIRRIYGECQKENRHRNRWKGIPAKPKTVSKLYTPFTKLFGRILQVFGLYEDTRQIFNTSKNHTELNPDYPVWPPLLLAGSGKHFVCSTVPRPLPDYALGISVLEVRLDSEDETRARDRLAACMQQLFTQQYNRRYAFGLVISEHALTVHMFDRSGVVSSPSLNYHAHPEQFSAIVAGLASTEASHLGLDTSIFREGIRGVVRTREPTGGKGKTKVVDYTLVANLYYSPDFVGRGTICFAAYEEAAPKKVYVIKDAWVTAEDLEGKESEASLVAHARRRGVTTGIPEVRHEEEVRAKGLAGRVGIDSIHHNRQRHSVDRSNVDRIHTRLVMSPFGKPLDRFSTRQELLLAYYDAVQAHRNLYEIGGILHRDIKPGNILINPKGEEGNRGVLIDFDHAIRTDDKSPYSTKKKIGTYLFMSRNALEGNEDQTYLDDLESFYYVLVYVALAYNAPGRPKEELPDPLDRWIKPMAADGKTGFLLSNFRPKVEAWFGGPFQKLLEQLHSVFKKILKQTLSAEYDEKHPPPVNPADVYETILTHIRHALVSVYSEDGQGGIESAPLPNVAGNANKRTSINGEDQEKSSIVFSWMTYSDPRKRRRTGMLTKVVTVATSRQRRSTAKYGITEIAARRRNR